MIPDPTDPLENPIFCVFVLLYRCAVYTLYISFTLELNAIATDEMKTKQAATTTAAANTFCMMMR